MVLILQENYSFNLLSHLFYILYLGFLNMFIVLIVRIKKSPGCFGELSENGKTLKKMTNFCNRIAATFPPETTKLPSGAKKPLVKKKRKALFLSKLPNSRRRRNSGQIKQATDFVRYLNKISEYMHII